MTRLSKDLMREFPEMKGFSKRNLETIRKWYLFYNQEDIIAQQLVTQLENNKQNDKDFKLSKTQLIQSIRHSITQIPWGHNIVIITKCKIFLEAIFYVQKTMQHNWSRSIHIL